MMVTTATTTSKNSNPFFDCLNSILTNKEYWYEEGKEYNPIGINVGLSQHLDSILHVNQLNQCWQHLSPRMHYDYCFYSIRKMKRKYAPWAKKPPANEDIERVMEYYGCNKRKAEDYLRVLTEEHLKIIREHVIQT